MKKQIKDVQQFHEKFGHPVGEKPDLIPDHRIKLRFDLMKEENEEYLKGAMEGDLVEVADALGDMAYILCGTIIEHGLQEKIGPIFDQIQFSNMSKLGEDGNPILREDGKILKGPNYFKPDIKFALEHDKEAELRQWLQLVELETVAIEDDSMDKKDAMEAFEYRVLEETKLRWTSIKSHMNQIIDNGDHLWYEFAGDLFIRNDIGRWEIYRISPKEF